MRFLGRGEALEVNTEGNHVNLLGGDAEIFGHVTRVICGSRDERVDVFNVGTDKFHAAGSPRFGEAVQEQIFPLQSQQDGSPSHSLHRFGKRNEKRKRETDHVWLRLRNEPIAKFFELLFNRPMLAFEHGNGHLTQELGVYADRPLRS